MSSLETDAGDWVRVFRGPCTPAMTLDDEEITMKTLWAFLKDDRGLETVEYAVMTALIVTALVTAITLLSGSISSRFGAVKTTVDAIP